RAKRLVIARIAGHASNLLHKFDTLLVALTKDGMAAIQMWRRNLGNEELRTISIRARVCHREASGTIKCQCRHDLIFELISGIAAAVAGWIAALNHELRNDPVKNGAVIKRSIVLGGSAHWVLPVLGTRGQSDKVGHRDRRLFLKQFAG